jgi:secreted PhoX family phosphatase
VCSNPYTSSELAGVCFSPDGNTMFVNIQYPGKTLAITGDWSRFYA